LTQYGQWDLAAVAHLTEGTPGTTPTTGTWLPLARVVGFTPEYKPTRLGSVGIGRQNPSDYDTVKKLYGYTVDLEMVKKVASPAYDPYTILQYIIELASGADGVPDNALESHSLLTKLDLTTDEFWWFKGCMVDKVEVSGNDVADRVKARIHALALWGDYGTTNPVSGTATLQANPAETSINFKDCDVLYDPTTPASIMDDVSAFKLSLERTIEPRGSHATLGKAYYRELVPTSRKWSAEVTKDFDSRDELEDFIDDVKTKLTIEVPNEADGSIFALTSGYLMPSTEVRYADLELVAIRMSGEFASIARSAHG